MVDRVLGSLCCNHCGNFHPSSKWCECEGAKKYRENSILRQLQTIDKNKESEIWEFFRDSSYYDMFCVRKKNERQFGQGFHLADGKEAECLCNLLNEMTKTPSENRGTMKNVSFTAKVGRRQETKNIDSLGELIRLINGGCPITNLRVVEDIPNISSKGPNADVITIVDEPYQAKCIHCGSPVSKQVFGPSAYIQGTMNVWMCSNGEALKGNCNSWIGYLSLEEWNSANQGEEIRENESNVQEPTSTVDLPSQPISDGSGDILDLIRYKTICRQELIKADLWTEELEALRIKAYEGIESLCRKNHDEQKRRINDYETNGTGCIDILNKDGKLVSVYVDGSIIVGDTSDSASNLPFVKYGFEELLDKDFRFDTLDVKITDKGSHQIARIDLRKGLSLEISSGEISDLTIFDENEEILHQTTLDNLIAVTPPKPSLQERKDKWMRACFDDEITDSPEERNRRFIEEALELVQSLDMTRHEAHFMVDYVFDRDKGEPFQEVGGSLLCLAALCNVHKIDMMEAAETELSRVWTKVEVIRGKQKQKPNFIDDLNCIVNTASPAVTELLYNSDGEDLVGSFKLILGLTPRKDLKGRYNTTSKIANLVEAVQIKVKASSENAKDAVK